MLSECKALSSLKSLNMFLNPNIDKRVSLCFKGAHWPVEEGLLSSWLLSFKVPWFLKTITIRKTESKIAQF